MPVKTVKKKAPARARAARGANCADPLRRKLHDLVNSLEAISLARQFVPRGPQSVGPLDAIEAALGDARKVLHKIDSELRGKRTTNRQSDRGRRD